ncbi:MAG: MBL fold metallo-hydrolase [Chloroflexi bacterium]|nr:MBL fold metallo-hydrolase [Chloroflexota bacterium]
MQIAPHVHHIPGTICNLFLIVEPDGLTLIDAGLGVMEKRVLKYIANLGRAPRDLKHILITHSDPDHIGALSALKSATGARVYASAIEARAIAHGTASRELKLVGWQKILFAILLPILGRFFSVRPTRVDEIVSDDQVLPILDGVRVLATSGHTPGHLSYFVPSAGVLFVGDSLVSEGTRLRGSRGMNNWDQKKADISVRLQAALAPRIVCSGHGAVVMDAADKFPT